MKKSIFGQKQSESFIIFFTKESDKAYDIVSSNYERMGRY